jgi:hypothetical protein
MVGRRSESQGHLFYEFRLDEAVPDDHHVRKIGAVLDLSWVYGELEPYYSQVGRPSIDPVLMIRMLIVGYVSGNPSADIAHCQYAPTTRADASEGLHQPPAPRR